MEAWGPLACNPAVIPEHELSVRSFGCLGHPSGGKASRARQQLHVDVPKALLVAVLMESTEVVPVGGVCPVC